MTAAKTEREMPSLNPPVENIEKVEIDGPEEHRNDSERQILVAFPF